MILTGHVFLVNRLEKRAKPGSVKEQWRDFFNRRHNRWHENGLQVV